MKRLFAFASTVGDRINPVAVKEFRQAVQSRWVSAIFLLFLLLNLGIVGGYLMLSPDAATSIDGGKNIFIALESILFFTCIGFVPLYAGIRLSLERNDTNIDLFFVTTITPGAIVRGKYLTAMALTLLIYSACMPFMILTYLLRGIDLPTIFAVLAIGFMVCAGVNAMGIFAGSVSGSWLLRGLVAVGMLIFLFMTAVMFIQSVSTAIIIGWGLFGVYTTWTTIGTILLFEALAIGLLYVLAVALLSPKPSNRMLVPRLYITGTWLVVGVVAAIWSYMQTSADPIIGWVIFSTFGFTAMMVDSLGERDSWTTRVKRTIPRNLLLRPFAFLFYSGSAGGIIWCAILFTSTILAAINWGRYLSANLSELHECCSNATLVFGYFLCYCLTTAFFCKVLLKNINIPNLSVLAAFLAVLACLAPYLVAFFLEDLGRTSLPWYMIGSPMVLTMENQAAIDAAGPFLLVWFVIAALVAMPWALGQWRRFKPLETTNLTPTN